MIIYFEEERVFGLFKDFQIDQELSTSNADEIVTIQEVDAEIYTR